MSTFELKNADCLEYMKTMPDNSIDCIITDPPYGLLNHRIETKIDLDLFFCEAHRILKDDSFFAYFGVMPQIVDWYNASKKNNLKFRNDITWVKRVISSPFGDIKRQKELIYIHSKNQAVYKKTEGKYEDIKCPLYLDGLLNIESFKRLLSEYKSGRSGRMRGSAKRNDDIYASYGSNYESLRMVEECNFTNVWSFLPHNKSQFNKDGFNVKHPTVKPVLLLERLIELTTNENDIVFDPFMGSGTTGIACMNLNRKFIGIELDSEYFEIAKNRIEKAYYSKNIEVADNDIINLLDYRTSGGSQMRLFK